MKVLRYVRYFAFIVLVLVVVGLVYWQFHALGLQQSVPSFGMRLYQLPVPGLSQLQHYQGVRDITVAHMMAIIMGLAVGCLGDKLLELHLFGLDYAEQIDVGNYTRVLIIVGAVVIGSDIVLFYRGVSEQGFLDSGGGLSAVMITVAYVGVMAFVTFIHVMLKRDL